MTGPNKYTKEQILVSQTLLAGSKSSCKTFDVFSTWLLAGVAGTFALMLSNFANLKHHLSIDSLQCSLVLFVSLFVVVVFEKLITVAILGMSGVIEVIHKYCEPGQDTDWNTKTIIQDFERATYFHTRMLVKKSFKKALDGDLSAPAKIVARLVQLQGILVLVSVILVVAIIVELTDALVQPAISPDHIGR